MLPLLYHLS
uniref:Uncharacterized protein n=1 Tax=Anguilla anguilla TaxID=7936 RepID=A0A0E9U4F8_ANGAN